MLLSGNVEVGSAEREAYSATRIVVTNSEHALGPRKITENYDRVGRSHYLWDTYCLPASSPAFKCTNPNGSPDVILTYITFKYPVRTAQ
jgi:hypothetical protein